MYRIMNIQPSTTNNPQQLPQNGNPVALAIAFGHFVNDFFANMLAPLLPLLSIKYGLSNAALGWIIAIFSLSADFTQPFFGMAIDNNRRGSYLVWAILWLGLIMSLIGRAHSFWALAVLAFLGGIGSGLFHPLGATLITRVVPYQKHGFWMSMHFVLGNLGYALAPLLVIPLATKFGLEASLWLFIPTLIFSLLLYFSGLKDVQDQGGVRSPLASLHLLKDHLHLVWVPVLAINCIVFLRTWVAAGLNTFLPTLMVQLGHSAIYGGQLLSVFLAVGALAGFLGGYLMDKIGARKLLSGSLLLGTLFLWLFYRSAGVWSWLTIALAGAAINCSLPVTVLEIQRLLPANAGLASGLISGLVSACVSFFLPLTGAIADIWGPNTALYLFLPLLPVAAVLTRFLPEHKPLQ